MFSVCCSKFLNIKTWHVLFTFFSAFCPSPFFLHPFLSWCLNPSLFPPCISGGSISYYEEIPSFGWNVKLRSWLTVIKDGTYHRESGFPGSPQIPKLAISSSPSVISCVSLHLRLELMCGEHYGANGCHASHPGGDAHQWWLRWVPLLRRALSING